MKKDKVVMGYLDMPYARVCVPLDVAHKIQSLLAEHATKIETLWGARGMRNTAVAEAYDTPAVHIAPAPDYDCTDITNSVMLERWKTLVRDREPDSAIIDPHDFINIGD